MADTWTDDLVAALRPLRFAPPVTHVYNPLEYARASWDLYMERFGQGPFAGLSDHMPLIGRFAIERPADAEFAPSTV